MQKKQNNNIQIISSEGEICLNITGDIMNYNCEDIINSLSMQMLKKPAKLSFTVNNLGQWDSSLLLVVYESIRLAQHENVSYDLNGLPKNLRKLIKLAFAVDRQPKHSEDDDMGLVETLGKNTLIIGQRTLKVLHFLRDILGAFGRLLSGRSIMRRIDFLNALNDCGPKAIAIVSLISFLVGLILAFVGAVQLQTFGAQIYVASLVTIGMCRIMGAIMAGIIMSGRTGSSYAATIGTMQVNEELDALQTMGLSQVDFLVLPRILALLIAMPILTMLSDFMGMLGGAFIGVFFMDLPYQEYWKYAFEAFKLNNFLVGIFHGMCFGIIIAVCGCYSGITCGRNADSVGVATTHSVVCAIVWMIVVTGIITIICQELGI